MNDLKEPNIIAPNDLAYQISEFDDGCIADYCLNFRENCISRLQEKIASCEAEIQRLDEKVTIYRRQIDAINQALKPTEVKVNRY